MSIASHVVSCTFASDNNSLVLPRAKTSLYGLDAFRFIGKKLWHTLPMEIKESRSLEIFKRTIRLVKTFDCSCKFYKTFVSSLGYL